MSPLRFAGKQVSKVRQRLAHNVRKLDDCGHGYVLRKLRAPSKTTTIKEEKNHFSNAA